MLQETYLYNPHGADVLLRRAISSRLPETLKSTQLVVPRRLCAYQRIDCAGVPRTKLASYARLQAQAHAPFTAHGSCAVRQGNWLHIWTWDAAEETAFSKKHKGKTPAKVLPQSLYSTPLGNGVQWLTTPGLPGGEAQLWKSAFLVDSMWFDAIPQDEAWVARLAQHPELNSIGWPQTLAPTGRTAARYGQSPWGRNLIPSRGHRTAIQWNHLAPAGLVAATATLACWGSLVFFEKEAHQQAIHKGMEIQERLMAELEPAQRARQRSTQTLQWIESVQALSPEPTTYSLVEKLAGIFTPQGLVVRELEISAPTIQATLVSTAGDSPRLTAVLGALEAHPWFYDARFVDVAGGTGFKFAWRLRSDAGSIAAGKVHP